MPVGRAWYVQAVKADWTQATKWVAGPFDTLADAMAEEKRLRDAKLYPDADLRSRLRYSKTLPTVVPRGEYNLAKRGERERLADNIATAARALGATVEIENWDGEPDVSLATPSLRATVWCVSVQGEMPIISWHGATYPLRSVPGAWADEQVNPAHRRKATSMPATYAELFDALETGICASVDGTAFDLGD